MRSGPIKYRGTMSTDYHKETARKLVLAGVPRLPDDVLEAGRLGREPTEEQEREAAERMAEACAAIRALYLQRDGGSYEEEDEDEDY